MGALDDEIPTSAAGVDCLVLEHGMHVKAAMRASVACRAVLHYLHQHGIAITVQRQRCHGLEMAAGKPLNPVLGPGARPVGACLLYTSDAADDSPPV